MLDDGKIGVRFSAEAENFLFATVYRQALGLDDRKIGVRFSAEGENFLVATVYRQALGLDDRKIGVRFSAEGENFLFATVYRQALGHSLSPPSLPHNGQNVRAVHLSLVLAFSTTATISFPHPGMSILKRCLISIQIPSAANYLGTPELHFSSCQQYLSS
jgi:hypothetical protein